MATSCLANPPQLGFGPRQVWSVDPQHGYPQHGYIPIATFVLPENCWTDHFYAPQVDAQRAFLEENADNRSAVAFIENQRHESRLYDKYKDYYGYVFYIGKKPN